MALSRLLNSFRVRLLLLLAALFVLTLGVQYYVNRTSVRTNTRLIVEQQQAIMAGVGLGVNSISSGLYLDQMRDQAKQPLLGEQAERVKNVLIVDEDGNIRDSLIENQTPRFNPDKSVRYVKVKDIGLPPLRSAVNLPSETAPLPEGMTIGQPTGGDPGAFYFPVTTERASLCNCRDGIQSDDNLKTSGASVLAIHTGSFTRDYLFDCDRRLALYSSNQLAVICRAAGGRWRLLFQSSDQ